MVIYNEKMYPKCGYKKKTLKKTKEKDKIKSKPGYNNMENNYNNEINIIAVYEREICKNNNNNGVTNDFLEKSGNLKENASQLRRSKRLLENKTKTEVNNLSKLKSRKRVFENNNNNNSLFNKINEKYKHLLNDVNLCGGNDNDIDELTNKLNNQLIVNLKNSEDLLLEDIERRIIRINNILTNKEIDIDNMSLSGKRKKEVEYEEIVKPIQMIPQSQWVYNTPDKQKIKRIAAKESKVPFIPAVFHTNKKMKILYDLKDDLVGKINVDKINTHQEVQIDKRFFKPIVEVSIQENMNNKAFENQFLTNNDNEQSYELKDVNFTIASESETNEIRMDYAWNSPQSNDVTMDVENNVYQVCTQRPAKSSKKLSRMNSMERRTLSFDETPKRTKSLQKMKSENFITNLTKETFVEQQQSSSMFCDNNKAAFKDRTNLIDNNINRPSTSKGIFTIQPNEIDNMYLVSDNCNGVETDCEFFSDTWPEMPEMQSPKPLKMYPRNV